MQGIRKLFLHKMKFILPYFTILILALVSIFPIKLIAGDKEIERIRKDSFVSQALPIDTIPPKRLPDKEDQLDPPKRPVHDFRGEGGSVRTREGIKEVPRSIRKLKPKPVIDRIPVRRPPMRIP